MWTHPGKKLLFMGGEFGQWNEWNHEASLDWHLLERPLHRGLSQWIGDLNRVLRQRGALHTRDFDTEGFRWIDASDSEQSVLTYLRRSARDEYLLVACNFTPVPRYNYRLGAPVAGTWTEVLNSDAGIYGGSGQGNQGAVATTPLPAHGFYHSLVVTLPPLSVVMFEPQG
jgi:1,4-alpha-glucan branching enzyme